MTSETKTIEKKSKTSLRHFVYLGIFVVTLWIITFASFIWGEQLDWIPVGDRGTFGDMFGGLNALFSGLAFAGIIFTIFMQREELKLQRDELRLTQETLEAQRQEMKTQNNTLKIQQFENTFFSLLKAHNDILNTIDIVATSGKVTKGRDCFRIFLKRLRSKTTASRFYPDQSKFNDYMEAYLEWYEKHQLEVGHYFRTLYNIFKFVDQSDIENKKFYTNIVRAQLSNQELAILFYNCLSENGNEKFKPLIEEYSILKSVPDKLLLNPEHKKKYKKSAFLKGKS